MEKKTYKKDIDIIREGMDGTHMYILQQGSVNVTKVQSLPPQSRKQPNFQGSGPDKVDVCKLGAGSLFGELAILYNCRRTATITSTEQGR